jgi:hypothetical protein
MIDRFRAARRGFLGSMIAAMGVVWWPWKARLVHAQWDVSEPQPGAHARLTVRMPGVADDALATVVVLLRTPRETLRWSAGEARFRGGIANLVVPLAYPYPGRVPGLYNYDAEVEIGGLKGRTQTSVRYRVGEPSWFA